MALHPCHLKLGFHGVQVLSGLGVTQNEDLDIIGLLNYVLGAMQCSYDYVTEDSVGEKLPNGTWTGLLGLLNRSEVDFVPAVLTVAEEEWDAVAFNYPFYIDEMVFVTRKPEYTPEIMALFRTLSLNVWLSLLACIVLFTLVCFVVLKHRCTLGDILLHVFAIGLNQEGNLVPKRVGEIILLSTWLGTMAVFTLCFKSVLLSFLTFPPLNGVRNVPELAAAVRAGKYYAFTYPGNDFESYLPKSPNVDIRVIGEHVLKNRRSNIENVFWQNPKYPINALVFLRTYVAFAEDMLYVSRDNMATFNFGTAVRKDFCCKDKIDMLVHRFLAAGINQKINNLRDYQNTVRIHHSIFSTTLPVDNSLRKLNVTDISGALIILVAGHCLSICVLIVECWVKRKERHRSLMRN